MRIYLISSCLFLLFCNNCTTKFNTPDLRDTFYLLDHCLDSNVMSTMGEEDVVNALMNCKSNESIKDVRLLTDECIVFIIAKKQTFLSTETVEDYLVFDFDGILPELNTEGDKSYYYTSPIWYDKNWYAIRLVALSM